jgi:glutaconate CoA-transferase subunit A
VNEDKRSSIEAAAGLVHRGETLALGGMTLYRRPVAFVCALLALAEPPGDLTLLCFTAGYESDLLVGAGLARRLRTCYFGLEIFGLAPMFTQMANEGAIDIVEETEASLSFGLRAALANVSFMPGLGWLGTDLPRLRPDVKTVEDPYHPGQHYMAFPAIRCDVAVIHALRADHSGNATLNLNLGVDYELALVADRVIVTAEEVVDRLTDAVDIPGAAVTAVVRAPQGAWPTSCYPCYPVGGGEILRYIDACNAGVFDVYLEALLRESGGTPPLE